MLPLRAQSQTLAWFAVLVALTGAAASVVGIAQPAPRTILETHVLAMPTPVATPAVVATPTAAVIAQAAQMSVVQSQPTLATAPSASSGAVTVLDESFSANTLGWPDNALSTGWFAAGGYHIEPREAGRFAAISAASPPSLQDVQVTAVFRKLGGPTGGGYGVILRDQGPGPRDGLNVGGRYYVLEVGDAGEVGIWRRDSDHWVELVGWTPSSAVRPGTAENQVVGRARGQTLELLVNGELAARAEDPSLNAGAPGVFVGGDGNSVLLSHLLVQRLD